MDKKTYIKAKEELLTAAEGSCQQFFNNNNLLLESAYYELLHKNLNSAKKIFKSLQDADIRAHWGYFVSCLTEGKIEGYPSYFELRNFYEVDLQIFFTYYLGEYIEEICKYNDWLFSINPEIFKYTGRAFLTNQYIDIGMFFLKKAKEKYFNDPELHYLLAECNINTGKYSEAMEDLRNCLTVLPGYYPAIKLKQKLEATL